MDELIKKLIEVDKTARKSVENAAQSKEKTSTNSPKRPKK